MTDLKFDEDATRKIAAFLNQLATLNASAVSRAQQRFPRALNAVFSMTNVNAVPTRRANEC